MYFDGICTLDELKKAYRELALANHLDRGGDTAVMQAINAEYDAKHDRMTREAISGAEYRRTVYEEMGWVGKNYSSSMSMGDLTKIIREYCRGHYPDCKFSVTRKHYNSITVALMEAPFEAIDPEKAGEYEIKHQHIQSYKQATPGAREILRDIERFGESYNYDHSDVMHDYFDRGFNLWVEIGKWNKPFNKCEQKVKRSRTRAVKVG